MTGSRNFSFRIASKAVFRPSPTSLFGGSSYLNQTNNPLISRESLFQDIFDSHVRRQHTGALHFNAIVVNADVDIVVEAVIAM
jgi:hypothetical protein